MKHASIAGRLLAVLILAAMAAPAAAVPKLARLFSDHAVLQRGRPIAVWGTADPGERLTVSLANQSRSVAADAEGNWRVEMPALPAGGPHRLSVAGASGQAIASDILIGDVWLCSGQSNMELQVSRALNSYNDTQSANDPELRILTVPHLSGPRPAAEFAAPVSWSAVTPQSVGDFSASCYYMVRELRRSQRVPIGAIAASWGGTPIRSWMDESAAATIGGEDYRQLIQHRDDPAAASQAFGERWAAWWRQASGDAPGAEPWKSSDRLAWSPVPRMTYWEQWGDPRFAEYNGMMWMRARFTLTAAQAAAGGTLSLGVIDELDEAFVNGVAVGGRYSWEAPRNYEVPAGLLRAGRNEILVNISDSSGGGGFGGPAEVLRLTLPGGEVVPLGDGWEYSVVTGSPGTPPRAPWDDAMGLTSIYNGMIAPLRDYGFTGVAWYQGEADVELPPAYSDRLQAMMTSWRRQLGRPQLPFLIVGLANFGPYATRPVISGWAALREQQRIATDRDPHAALIVDMDLGERLDIHPANKQEVGRRLARAARVLAYGSDEPIGPEPAARAAREAGGYRIAFTGVTGELRTWSSERALAFELCGETQDSCRFADARAEGSSVRIADDGRPATRIRHAWADSPVTNLYDDAPLPVGPFEVPIGPAN